MFKIDCNSMETTLSQELTSFSGEFKIDCNSMETPIQNGYTFTLPKV